VLNVRTSIGQRGARTWEKDTKTHQQRRITIDVQTIGLLKAYRQQCAERAGLGSEMPGDARVFSLLPDGSTWIKPDTVSQRYERMCTRLGWDMHIHQLRHYSATELIAAGVDVRTVAGRLGHGGGGATTLKVYSAFVAEADQRAAGSLAGRMPELPIKLIGTGALSLLEPQPSAAEEPSSPYRRIAADLRGAITSGVIRPGEQLPTVDGLAARYAVSHGTAQRAIAVLSADGLVAVSRGRRATVATRPRGQSRMATLRLWSTSRVATAGVSNFWPPAGETAVATATLAVCRGHLDERPWPRDDRRSCACEVATCPSLDIQAN